MSYGIKVYLHTNTHTDTNASSFMWMNNINVNLNVEMKVVYFYFSLFSMENFLDFAYAYGKDAVTHEIIQMTLVGIR